MSDHPADRLSAFLDSELQGDERARVEAHLAACSECSALLSEFAGIDAVVRTLPEEAPEGYFDTFVARLRPRLRRPGARRVWRVPAWGLAAAAVLAAAVIAPWLLRRSSQPGADVENIARVPRPASPALAPPAPATAAKARPDASASTFALEPKADTAPKDKRSVLQRSASDQRQQGRVAAGAPARRELTPAPAEAEVGTIASEVVTVDAGEATASREEAVPVPEAPAVSQPAAETPQRVAVDGVARRLEERVETTTPADALARTAAAEAPPVKDAGAAEQRAARFADLSAHTATTVEEARSLRDAYREYARDHASTEEAGMAWLRALELGAQAFRLGQATEDWKTLQADARMAKAFWVKRDPGRLARIGEILSSAVPR